MSARSFTQAPAGEQGLKPWEMSFNGYFWYDMPGGYEGEDSQKMNFYLFRKGRLDVEEEKECDVFSADGISEIAVDDRPRNKPKLVMKQHRRQGRVGLRAVKPQLQVEELRLQEEQRSAAKAVLRTRLMKWRLDGALRQISRLCEVNYDNLCRFVREGNALGEERQAKVSAFLDKLDAREVVLGKSGRGNNLQGAERAVKCPEGSIPFRQWIEREAAKLTLEPHSLYAFLNRNPDRMPPLNKVHGRAWFVKPECVLEGYVPSVRWASRLLKKKRTAGNVKRYVEVAA